MQVSAPQTSSLPLSGGLAAAMPGGFAELLMGLGVDAAAAMPAEAVASPVGGVRPMAAKPHAAAVAKTTEASAAEADEPTGPEQAAPVDGAVSALALAGAMVVVLSDPAPARDNDAPTAEAAPAATSAAAVPGAGALPADAAQPAPIRVSVPVPTREVVEASVQPATTVPAAGATPSESAEVAGAAMPSSTAEPASTRDGAMTAASGPVAALESSVEPAAAPEEAETARPPAASGARRPRSVERRAVEATPADGPTGSTSTAAGSPRVERPAATNGAPTDRAELPAARAEVTAPAADVARSTDAALPMPGGETLPAAGSDGDVAATPGHAAPSHVPEAPASQVAVHLSRRLSGGETLVVSLSPEELGEVEIEIELDDEGHARAHIAAELPSTLDLIQRDASVLERALETAGLDLAPDALTFDLRRDGQTPQQRREPARSSWTATGRSADLPAVALPTTPSSRLLDLQV
ncbi:MAG TPA: flagellar hook-length control protein FliK [Geminicoccaceae bacterium]|nr:flagellar hook-length control protein FliK [Geminicoccus sp.]HMU49636.1 flagellar hook-length control protein FliK [Geminicoccaceae bacterium]